MKRLVCAVSICALLAGCAVPAPIIDPASVADEGKYQTDLAACQTIAANAVPDEGTSAVLGAVGGILLGAAFGAATGAIFGNAGGGAALGGDIGAFSAGTSAAADSHLTRKEVVGNCMTGRGYNVLAVR